jgi:chaperonin GroES
MPVKPGDHVVFPAAAGAWVEVEEERLLVCRVGELLGVLERNEECAACAGRPLAPHESCPVCGREGSLGSASSGEHLE